MITCYWNRGKLVCQNPEGAVKSIGVKRGDRVLSVVLACQGHVPTAMQDAMALAHRIGGRVASVALMPPERVINDDPDVNAGAFIPRSEFARMKLAAQHLGMSQRKFVRAAINNQVMMTYFDQEGKQ